MITDDESHCHLCHLSMALDAYPKEIVGRSVGPTLDAIYPTKVLKMALKRTEGKEVHLTRQSDRGCQYASREYVALLKPHWIRIKIQEYSSPPPSLGPSAPPLPATTRAFALPPARKHQKARAPAAPQRAEGMTRPTPPTANRPWTTANDRGAKEKTKQAFGRREGPCDRRPPSRIQEKVDRTHPPASHVLEPRLAHQGHDASDELYRALEPDVST